MREGRAYIKISIYRYFKITFFYIYFQSSIYRFLNLIATVLIEIGSKIVSQRITSRKTVKFKLNYNLISQDDRQTERRLSTANNRLFRLP